MKLVILCLATFVKALVMLSNLAHLLGQVVIISQIFSQTDHVTVSVRTEKRPTVPCTDILHHNSTVLPPSPRKTLIIFTEKVYASGASLRQLMGTCVEMCSTDPELELTCPTGYVCRSNGCGHTCQAESVSSLSGCLGAMCALYCPYGFMTGPDGCPICRCQTLEEVVVS